METEMGNIKVGFDFDGTLTRVDVQRYARLLIKLGVDVHIVTARHKEFDLFDGKHEDLMTIAAKVGIDTDNIHFLNCSDKSKFYREHPDFLYHLDDNWFVVDDLNEYSGVIGICVLDDNWTMKCDDLLKNKPLENIEKAIVRKQVYNLLMANKNTNPVELLDIIKRDIEKKLNNDK